MGQHLLKSGTLTLRPRHELENLQNGSVLAGLSVGQHLLAAYLKSLRAVLRVQFTRKGLKGGKAGVARLVEESPVVQVCSTACF